MTCITWWDGSGQAARHFSESLRIFRATVGESSPLTAGALATYGKLRMRQGPEHHKEAAVLLTKARSPSLSLEGTVECTAECTTECTVHRSVECSRLSNALWNAVLPTQGAAAGGGHCHVMHDVMHYVMHHVMH